MYVYACPWEEYSRYSKAVRKENCIAAQRRDGSICRPWLLEAGTNPGVVEATHFI